MDFGAPAAADSSQEAKAHKRRGVRTTAQDDEEKRYKEMIITIGKLALSSALAARTLKAVTVQCIKMNVNSQWIVWHKEGTGGYEVLQKQHKDAGMTMEAVKDKIGIPSVHGFNRLCVKMLEILDEKVKTLEKDKDKDQQSHNAFEDQKAKTLNIKKSIESWASKGIWKYIHRHIPHSKVCNMFQSNEKKYEISAPMEVMVNEMMNDFESVADFTPTHVWMMIKAEMLKEKTSKEMMGVAPAGDLERRIQEFLDAEKEKMQ